MTRLPTKVAMSHGNLGRPNRFVPSGVDPSSWIGFEQRIQERRFKALVETISIAIVRRDGVAARIALEEARELRPAAPELQTLSARVALLPRGPHPSAASPQLWYRGLSAVAMFVVGIGLVVGLEWIRSGDQHTVTTIATAGPASNAAAPVALAPAPIAPPAAVPESEPTVQPAVETIDTAPLASGGVSGQPPSDAKAVVSDRKSLVREEPVGTAGVSRAPVAGAAAAAAPNRSTFRPAVQTPSPVTRRPDAEQAAAPGREIPDDYVAPGARSETRPGYVETAPSSAAIAANIMPQPVSVIAPPPAAPILPAKTTTVASAAARNDNSRVEQVLHQYARAYEQLDPTAARAVWPTVDERALSRAFASLESQDVSFDTCDIDVKGNVANASCRGTASYVGKVGSRQARTEARQWTFQLRLHGDDWKIEKAQAR